MRKHFFRFFSATLHLLHLDSETGVNSLAQQSPHFCGAHCCASAAYCWACSSTISQTKNTAPRQVTRAFHDEIHEIS